MSWLRFVTVDALCIAAEVTAALLLLAFAIPEKSKGTGGDPKADENRKKLLELARRAYLDHQILFGLYWLEAQDPKSLATPTENDADVSTMDTLGWLDRLSGSYNRAFLDEFLPLWLSLPSDRRQGSALTMLAVHEYAEMVRNRGPIEVEKTLREIGQYTEGAIVGRYPPDRFLIIGFGQGASEAFETVKEFQAFIGEQSKNEESLLKDVRLVASIVELSEESPTFDDLVSDLDDGVTQASESGESCVGRSDGNWSAAPPPPTGRAKTRTRTSTRSSDVAGKGKSTSPSNTDPDGVSAEEGSNRSANSHSSDVSSAKEATKPNQTSANDSDSGQTGKAENTEKKSSDVSAVASTEEIEALFQQLKKKDKPPVEPEQPALTAVKPHEDNANDVASADDIAALFAQAKTTAGPTVPATSSQPTTTPVAVTENLNDTASADDIAALFAAVQGAKPESVPVATKAETPIDPTSPSPPTKPVEEIHLGEEATADDIASLFATIKGSSPQPAPTEAKSKPSMPPVDPSETATADDIAELFRSVQSAVSPESASEPGPKPPAPAQEIDLSETASADDIEALLKSMGR
jgi:GGDEF domain-containing protein